MFRLCCALLISACILAAQATPGLTTIHAFQGSPSDGGYPEGGVVFGSAGVLYGTTSEDGAFGFGTVFSLTPPAAPGGSWTETTLYSFTGEADGSYPQGAVAVAADGTLYGTTYAGTVFSLTPPASPGGAWTHTVLHSFSDDTGDGTYPNGGVVIGPGGILYGATYTGAVNNLGAVYSVTPPAYAGGEWTERVLYSFKGGDTDGSMPSSSVVVDAAGVLYGTTMEGGPANFGVVFSLTPPASGDGPWIEKLLHVFSGDDGFYPNGLAIDHQGRLYGTTSYGSTSDGVVFSLTATGSSDVWNYSILHSFPAYSGDGEFPLASVAIGAGGMLFGTTQAGGRAHGTVFTLKPPASPGGAWTETVTHRFTGGADGGDPWGAITIGPDGLLYGTTTQGAGPGGGSVFSLTR